MGGDYGIGHAACLAAQLPYGSRVIALLREEMGKEGTGTTQGETHSIDEYMEILSKPRREVQHG